MEINRQLSFIHSLSKLLRSLYYMSGTEAMVWVSEKDKAVVGGDAQVSGFVDRILLL